LGNFDFHQRFHALRLLKTAKSGPKCSKLTLMGHRAYKVGEFQGNHVGRAPSRGVSWIL
jgi:hypothetical protein